MTDEEKKRRDEWLQTDKGKEMFAKWKDSMSKTACPTKVNGKECPKGDKCGFSHSESLIKTARANKAAAQPKTSVKAGKKSAVASAGRRDK